jgi:hypothetical protein
MQISINTGIDLAPQRFERFLVWRQTQLPQCRFEQRL